MAAGVVCFHDAAKVASDPIEEAGAVVRHEVNGNEAFRGIRRPSSDDVTIHFRTGTDFSKV